MSDYNSSLPIRTENAGDAIVKIADATVTSQQLAINADGSVNITDNGASLTVDASNLDIRDLTHVSDSVKIGDGTDFLEVNADGSLNVAFAAGAEIKITDGTDDLAINADGSLNAVVSATDLDIRDLAFATDKVDVSGSSVELGATTLAALESITVQNGAGASAVNIQDGGNSITVDGSVTVSATNLDIRDLVFASDKVDVSGSSVTVSATDLDVRDLAFATDKVYVSGSSVTVSATDLDVRDLTHVSDSVKVGDGSDFLAINADGSINVVIADASPGTAINDYSTASAVAGGGTSNHDYTSVGNFYLNQIHASGSGKMKIEVLVNAVSKFVCFSSTANPNMDIQIANPILATSGQVVRIIRTNKEGSSMDLYSTISGYNA